MMEAFGIYIMHILLTYNTLYAGICKTLLCRRGVAEEQLQKVSDTVSFLGKLNRFKKIGGELATRQQIEDCMCVLPFGVVYHIICIPRIFLLMLYNDIIVACL